MCFGHFRQLMRMWPISGRVNSPLNDDEQLLDEIKPAEMEEAG